ncbi:MAG: hypothetical protein AAF600_08320 [Bacteroidota bacterium]
MNSILQEINIWKEEIEYLREKSKAYVANENLIAFYGSSSIRLWDNMALDLAPHETLNLGFGGSSYKWCNHFFGEVFEFIQPTKIIIYAGDNDLGTGTLENDIIHSVNNLLTKKETIFGGIPTSIISVKPSPDRLYLKKNMESLNKRLSQKIHQITNGSFIDIYTPMLTTEGKVRPELYLADQLHMNLKGYEIWKKVIKDHLE